MSFSPTFVLLVFGPDGTITTDIGLTLTTNADTVILGPGGATFGNDSGAVAGSYSNTGQVTGEPIVAVSGNFQTFVAGAIVQISGTAATGTIALDAAITVDICIGNLESFAVVVPAGQTSGTFSVPPAGPGVPREFDHRKALGQFRAGLKTLKRGSR